MDLWQRARSFAEEAAKRSQEITKEAAKRSQVITKGAAEIVSETAKKSREIATEATKRADLIKVEALKRADQIKTLAEGISSVQPIPTKDPAPDPQQPDLEKFGVTVELREFVKEITMSTFQDCPLEGRFGFGSRVLDFGLGIVGFVFAAFFAVDWGLGWSVSRF